MPPRKSHNLQRQRTLGKAQEGLSDRYQAPEPPLTHAQRDGPALQAYRRNLLVRKFSLEPDPAPALRHGLPQDRPQQEDHHQHR